jgi:hypothetical protein
VSFIELSERKIANPSPSGKGSATLRAPTAGFDNPDLSVYFTRVYSAAVRTPTRAIPNTSGSPSPVEAHKGAIIGGAVGGAVLILALATGCICFLGRQRRRRRMEASLQQPPQELYAPTKSSAFQNSPQSMYQPPMQPPIQLPANEQYQSPIEIGGHEVASAAYGSATTEKSTYSFQHSTPPFAPSAQSIHYGHSSHQGSLSGSPVPYQPSPGQQTYYPPPEEHNASQAGPQQFTIPTPTYSHGSQAYSPSSINQPHHSPPR